MSTLRTCRVVIATVAAVVLLSACGSDGDSSASAPTTSASKPAAAKENATTAPVCYDLYVAGKTTPCAENTIGPGGGVIFYDAKTVQPWGRFLEVAPWNWNPQYGPGESENCDCGADSRSLLRPRVDETQDRWSPNFNVRPIRAF